MRTVKLFGKYLGGHPQYPRARASARLVCDEAGVSIQGTFTSKKLIQLPWTDIAEVAIDGTDTIASRVTATRLATLGIFALAAPKKKDEKTAFVTCRASSGDLAFQVPGGDPHKLQARLAEATARVRQIPLDGDHLVAERPPESPDSQ